MTQRNPPAPIALTRVKARPSRAASDASMNASPYFADRHEAGRRLAAAAMAADLGRDAVVYALPRGGVPVGYEIALALKVPLDILLVRKIGAPGQPELAVAAVAEGAGAGLVVNDDVRAMIGADDVYLKEARTAALAEIERRRKIYLGGLARIDPKGKTAIVVDDGLATGATAKAAVRALKAEGAAKVVLAIPVAPADAVRALAQEADQVICLSTPAEFYGVGQFYRDFHQLSDAETVALLQRAERPG